MNFPSIARSFLLRPRSFRERTINASLWSIVDAVGNNVLRLGSNLILTRLLLPEAFGAVAIVAAIQTGLILITDISVHRSIVQSPSGEDVRFLRVSWVVQATRGGILTLAMLVTGLLTWLLAPTLAVPGTIYAAPELPGLIALASLSMVAGGFESTNTLLAIRRIRLSRLVLLSVLTQVVSITATVTLALVSPTPWAPIWGIIIGTAFRTGLSHRMFEGPRMRFEWDRKIADELWQLAKWLIVSTIFTFVATNADKLILGGLLKSTTFGYYTVASTWVAAVALLLGKFTDPVAHSAFSEIRRSAPARAASVYAQFRNANDLIRLATFILMLVFAPTFVAILYPGHYASAAAFIPLLGLTVLAGRIELLKMFVLSGGDSRTTMHASALQAIAVVVGLPVGYALLGVTGLVIASALSQLASGPILFLRARQALGGRRLLIEAAISLLIVVAAIATYLQFAGGLS